MTTRSILLASAVCALVTPAVAAPELPVSVELLPGWREDGRHYAGLRLTLEPGWKTYWRAPGDAGIPPVFDWSGSENLAGADVQFPVPDVFDVAGLRTIGYADEVVLPLTFRPATPGAPIRLSGEVQLGVCEDVCIPVSFRLSATLPAGGRQDAAIARAQADRPRAGGAMACRVTPISDGLRLEVEIDMPGTGATPAMVIETADPSVWVSAPEVTIRGGRMTASADLVPPDAIPFALERDGLRMTLIADGAAVEMRGCD